MEQAMSDIRIILETKQLDTCSSGWLEAIEGVSRADVLREIDAVPGKYHIERLIALLSPAADHFLEQMAQVGRQLTIRRFGRTIQLYVPLYVSNYCINSCRYCGYSSSAGGDCTRLTIEEALAEADIIAGEGFRHILIVSGEDPGFVTVDYLAELAAGLRKRFSSISVEIYPLDREQYRRLFEAGIDGVTLYQETYDRSVYARCHPSGPKSDYDRRLETHDLAGSAGMRRMGIGVLLGLGDWRLETLALAEHADYLMKKYWRSQVSFSFPRLRPARGMQAEFGHLVGDRDMVKMMLALRLCFADAGIVLSTRESASLRDNLIRLCVTQISAGSKTSPGGYGGHIQSTRQFEIDDERTAAEVAAMIDAAGFQPVWKDWDKAFSVLP